jgi:hypothetical protein
VKKIIIKRSAAAQVREPPTADLVIVADTAVRAAVADAQTHHADITSERIPLTDPFASTPLYCMSEDKTYKQMFIAFWNFDEVTSDVRKQSIEDKSGNGYVLYRGTPTDSEPTEPFKLPMQGYLFEKDMFTWSALPILLHNYPGFTFDAWLRRESKPTILNNMGTRAFGFYIERIAGGSIDYGFEVSDENNRIIVTLNNKPQQSA